LITISEAGVPVVLFGYGDVLIGSCRDGVLKFKTSDYRHDIGPIALSDETWGAGRDLFFFHFSSTKSVDVLVQALQEVKEMMTEKTFWSLRQGTRSRSAISHAQPDSCEGSE